MLWRLATWDVLVVGLAVSLGRGVDPAVLVVIAFLAWSARMPQAGPERSGPLSRG